MAAASAHDSQTLSRTSSAMSFSSEDDAASMTSSVTISTTRRTRKRFTNAQLTMLEQLFHQNTHPSRADREVVAKAGDMEIRSVTIWFQNKRQTERKAQANGVSNNSTANSQGNVPPITSTMHTFSVHGPAHHSSRNASPPFSSASRSTSVSATSSRPSLDRVASRTELRVGAPRTPRRGGPIWDNMPSSPLAPPVSPPHREFIDFGKRRTLEWACAAARLADKDGHASGMSSGFSGSSAPSSLSGSGSGRGRTIHRDEHPPQHGQIQEQSRQRRDSERGPYAQPSMDVDVTDDDEEDHEAITPPSTWGKGDTRWSGERGSEGQVVPTVPSGTPLPKGVDDDDMFKAALALCGLGRRT